MAALIITLREGLEIALVLAVLTAYLARTGRSALNRYVYQGAAAAVAFSVGAALVLSRLGISPENALAEGILFLVAAALVTSMFVWMRRSGQQMGRTVKEQLDKMSTKNSAQLRPALAFLSFFLVAREGVEIVVFLSALALAGGRGVPTFIGAIGGLSLAAVLGVMFVRGALKVDLGRFFSATALVLLVLAVQFALKSIREFMEIGAVPGPALAERIIDALTGPAVTYAVLVLLIAVPLLLLGQGVIRGARRT